MVYADTGVEVTKDNQLIRLRHSRQKCIQVLVEFVSCGVRTGHRRSVAVDDDGEFASLKRQMETHQTIVDALRQTGRPSHDVLSEGKSDTRILSLSIEVTAREVEVDTHLPQLALFGEPGRVECNDVHLSAP
nr:unnamed protein product [Spirometra erinaceieuropaei]